MNDNNYENEDFIINKGFYNEIKDLVNCPICNKIINKPMQCSICENNFCEKCINEYIKKSNTCPFNCQNLKVLEKEYFNVCLSNITMFHHESKSRGFEASKEKHERFLSEQEYMKKKWGKKLDEDKFFSKNNF